MLWSRWIIYGIPATVALLSVWSGRKAAESLASHSGLVLAAAEGIVPSLNPFLPACEVDRQVTDLTHEALLKIGATGHMEPAIAESWTWSQTSSVWFAGEEYAGIVAKRLNALSTEVKEKWHLTNVEASGKEVRLLFSNPGTRPVTTIMPLIADQGPLPVEFIRVELKEQARGYHEFFLKNAVEREQIKSIWFDGPNAYELAVSGETMKFYEELNLFYQNRPALQPRVRTLRTAPMLHRPKLELTLRADAKFNDGSAVTSDDVRATVGLVLSQPWPVAGRDALRLIAEWDSSEPHKVRATFKELYGPALTAFIGLPILPASWIEKHREALKNGDPRVFPDHPPPGAGPARIDQMDAEAITLQGDHRVKFLHGLSLKRIRTGFAMRAIDAYWPGWNSAASFENDRTLKLHTSPPRTRLTVLWNCRKPPLDNPRVREALELAVDRPALVRLLFQTQIPICEGIFQPGLWFAEKITPSAFNLEQSLRVLRELGWERTGDGPQRKGGDSFRIELMTVAGNNERAAVARWLQASWKKLGVEVTINSVPSEEFVNQRLPEHLFDGALLGLDFENTWDQTPNWHSSQARGGLNFTGIADATLDGLLEELRAEFDPERVPVLAHDVEKRIVMAHAFLTLFPGRNPVAIRNDALPDWQSLGAESTFSLRALIRPAVKQP